MFVKPWGRSGSDVLDIGSSEPPSRWRFAHSFRPEVCYGKGTGRTTTRWTQSKGESPCDAIPEHASTKLAPYGEAHGCHKCNVDELSHAFEFSVVQVRRNLETKVSGNVVKSA